MADRRPTLKRRRSSSMPPPLKRLKKEREGGGRMEDVEDVEEVEVEVKVEGVGVKKEPAVVVKRERKFKRAKRTKVEKEFTMPKVLSVEGTVLVCGDGSMGQLGCGDDVDERKVPGPIPNLKDIQFCSMESAYLQTALLIKNSKGETEVLTWGCNDDTAAHVLGRDGAENVPMPVEALSNKNIVQISVGQYHMTALDNKGKLYFWGNYKVDEFIGPTIHEEPHESIMYPKLHRDVFDYKVASVASGGNHTCFITESGNLYEFGWTKRDENLNQKLLRKNLIPKRVPSPKGFSKAIQVEAGQVHTLALFEDEHSGERVLASWGNNHHGQLGHGHTSTVEEPTIINGLPKEIEKFSCGDFHCIVLTKDHRVFSWGRNSYGQCGITHSDPQVTDILVPTEVVFPNLGADYIIDVEGGGNHGLVATSEGKAYAWGFGSENQLGLNSDDDVVPKPTLLKSNAISRFKVSQVFAGSSHSLFFAPKVATPTPINPPKQ